MDIRVKTKSTRRHSSVSSNDSSRLLLKTVYLKMPLLFTQLLLTVIMKIRIYKYKFAYNLFIHKN